MSRSLSVLPVLHLAFAPSAIGSLLGFKKRTPKPENPADADGLARAPFLNPPVLSGERFLSFVLVSKDGKPPAAVHITAKSPAGDLDVRLPVTEADVVQVTNGVHLCSAMCRGGCAVIL